MILLIITDEINKNNSVADLGRRHEEFPQFRQKNRKFLILISRYNLQIFLIVLFLKKPFKNCFKKKSKNRFDGFFSFKNQFGSFFSSENRFGTF